MKKLVVLGGGGVRSPFLAKSLATNARRLGINKIVLMDKSEEKLNIYGKIAKKIASYIDPTVSFTLSSSPREALKDADYIITTIRVGEDYGRVQDERIALKNGVLGQETTGAGGFGMALRSVPVIIDYCNIIKEVSSKDAVLFNFTNPSGIVTQAMNFAGFKNVFGICDAPTEFIKQICELLEEKKEDVSVECFGLNHLSWFRNIKVRGIDVTDKVLNHKDLFTKTEMRLFEPGLLKISENLMLNEYLYFYYYREKAIDSILKSGKTRGELIYEINQEMTSELKNINIEKDFDNAFKIFMNYYLKRENTYMSIESQQEKYAKWENFTLEEYIKKEDTGGYAGVALNIIEALQNGKQSEMVISVPNKGAIDFLDYNDVVEVTCELDKDGVKPKNIENIPIMQRNLINQIKEYERLTVEAVFEKDKEKAIKALTTHPLISSYSLAKKLVKEYLEAHKEYVGDWN